MFSSLILKDFVRRRRSPISTLVMLAFPFVMAGMIGMVSGGGGAELPTIEVLVADLEGGLLGQLLEKAGTGSGEVPLVVTPVSLEEGQRRMARGEASALLVIPEGFTDDWLDGRPTRLRVVRNPAEGIKPEIVEQGVLVLATYLDVAAKVLGDDLDALRRMVEDDRVPTLAQVTGLAAAFHSRTLQAERWLFPPVVQIGSEKETGGDPINVFGYVLVMVSVMSVLFVAIRAVTDLYEDQRTGMLRRQLSTPLPIAWIVAAKIVFAVLFSVSVMAILVAAGAALGWFQSSFDGLGLFVHTLSFGLAAAGLMTLLVSLVRTEKQAGILSWIVVMVMSVLGGSMFPADQLPAFAQPFSRLTLNYWAVEGYLDLLVRGEGMGAALPRSVLLAVVGVITALVGQALLGRRLRGGGLA